MSAKGSAPSGYESFPPRSSKVVRYSAAYIAFLGGFAIIDSLHRYYQYEMWQFISAEDLVGTGIYILLPWLLHIAVIEILSRGSD